MRSNAETNVIIHTLSSYCSLKKCIALENGHFCKVIQKRYKSYAFLCSLFMFTCYNTTKRLHTTNTYRKDLNLSTDVRNTTIAMNNLHRNELN